MGPHAAAVYPFLFAVTRRSASLECPQPYSGRTVVHPHRPPSVARTPRAAFVALEAGGSAAGPCAACRIRGLSPSAAAGDDPRTQPKQPNRDRSPRSLGPVNTIRMHSPTRDRPKGVKSGGCFSVRHLVATSRGESAKQRFVIPLSPVMPFPMPASC